MKIIASLPRNHQTWGINYATIKLLGFSGKYQGFFTDLRLFPDLYNQIIRLADYFTNQNSKLKYAALEAFALICSSSYNK